MPSDILTFTRRRLSETWREVARRPTLVPVLVLLDILMMAVFLLVYPPIFQRINAYLTRVSALLTEYTQGLTSPQPLMAMIRNAGGMGYAKNILILGLIALLASYLIYVFFQGSVWHVLLRKGSRVSYATYMKRFSLIALVWGVAFVVINALSTYLNFQTLSANPSADLSRPWYIIVLFVILTYLTLVSAIPISKHGAKKALKETFLLGWRRLPSLGVPFLLIIALFLAIDQILTAVQETALLIPLGFLLIFPALAFSRVLMMKSVRKVT